MNTTNALYSNLYCEKSSSVKFMVLTKVTAMDIDTDSEQSTQSQTESEDKTPDTSQRGIPFTFLHASRRFHAKKASVVSLKYYPPHFFLVG
jgi:hypothetical protein